MTSSIYVALSAQMALQRRMETVANNVANLNTAGFRAEEVRFETVLSKMGPREVSYADSGDSYISRRSGSVSPDWQSARRWRSPVTPGSACRHRTASPTPATAGCR